MVIRYLGTAAAEGVPGAFCACPTCRDARLRGGKNIRTRSQAIINDDLLIDFPCDTYTHIVQNDIDFMSINACIITHIHWDHFVIDDLNCINRCSHPDPEWNGITFYGSCDIKQKLEQLSPDVNGLVKYSIVEPFCPFHAGSYTITALKANHGTPHPYIYIVDDGEKKLLYANDTDLFPEETWQYLAKTQTVFNLVSMDCTSGPQETINYVGHMCLGYNKRCRARLFEIGAADSNTQWVLNHFSHNGLGRNYDEFNIVASKDGFVTAYDGMQIVL